LPVNKENDQMKVYFSGNLSKKGKGNLKKKLKKANL
jgi:hypothetical protein